MQKPYVEHIVGKRRRDQSEFHALRFHGPFHRPIFLTPGQVKTVLNLAKEAQKILNLIPDLPEKFYEKQHQTVNETVSELERGIK